MQENELKEMSIIDHFNDLIKFLWHSFLGIAVGTGIVALSIKYVYDYILFAPKNPDFITYKFFCEISDVLCVNYIPINIINRQMAGQFSAHFWTSITFGIIIAFPYIIYELWKFIQPALYKYENRLRFVIIGTTIFLLGVMFGYFIITPLSIKDLTNHITYDGIVKNVELLSYIYLILKNIFVSGFVFVIPFIIYSYLKNEVLQVQTN